MFMLRVLSPNNPKSTYLEVRSHAELHMVVGSISLSSKLGVDISASHSCNARIQNLTKSTGSTSLIIREMQSKPQRDTTSHLLEWLSSKRQEITIVGKDVEVKEPLCTVVGNVNWCSHYEKQQGVFSKN